MLMLKFYAFLDFLNMNFQAIAIEWILFQKYAFENYGRQEQIEKEMLENRQILRFDHYI